jgi:hypothetical protein
MGPKMRVPFLLLHDRYVGWIRSQENLYTSGKESDRDCGTTSGTPADLETKDARRCNARAGGPPNCD